MTERRAPVTHREIPKATSGNFWGVDLKKGIAHRHTVDVHFVSLTTALVKIREQGLSVELQQIDRRS